MPISGIFDLEPIALGVLNDKLQLSAEEVAKLSPQKNLADGSPPLRLFVGGAELPELMRQSQDYAAQRTPADCGSTYQFCLATTTFPFSMNLRIQTGRWFVHSWTSSR